MLAFPLFISDTSDYATLGIGPEATSEEINEAKLELIDRIKAIRRQIDRKIDGVYRDVDGLKAASEELKELRGRGDVANPEALRAAELRLAGLEEKARLLAPEFQEWTERSAELERQIHDVNRMGIHKREERLAYDRRNPPFELLQLARPRRDCFSDPRVVLAMLRRELVELLDSRGEDVFHPSDLIRDDFTGDYCFNPILDTPQP
jgi:hypothetical protein